MEASSDKGKHVECINENCTNPIKKGNKKCSACIMRKYRSNVKEKNNSSEREKVSNQVVLEPSEEIKKMLHSSQLWISLQSLENDQNGVQIIDAKTELFVNYKHNNFSDKRNDEALRSLKPSIYDHLKELIEKFMIHKAEELVNRLEEKTIKLNFSHFAILFSNQSDFSQIPHVDAEASDYIFFYALGDDVIPSTLVYKGDNVTSQQAAEFLNLSSDTKMVQIDHFRNFFQARANIVNNMKPVAEEGWQPGTLCVVKGGKIHAAPSHKDPRAVLVFFGTPENASDTYNSDVQWHTWSIISDILMNNREFSLEDKSNMMKAHTKVVGDWLIDERCLRHSSYLKDKDIAIKYLQSFKKMTSRRPEKRKSS